MALTISNGRVVALLLVTSFNLFAVTGAEQSISRLEKHYNAARTVQLQFVESYSMQGHPRPPEAGTLTLRKQGKMRWEYSQPRGKLFISDGKSVFLYTARDNRVEKVLLKDTEDMRAPLAFLLGHLDMKKEFRDFELRSGSGGDWLTARAKSERVPYSRIEMFVLPDGAVRDLKIVERDQSELAFRFSGEKLNLPVADKTFQFEIPPGAEMADPVPVLGQGK